MNKARRVRKAVILAAGQSRRLESLNLAKPKPLLEVRGQPLLGWHLENCAQNGIEHVYINLHHLPEQIRDFAGDGARWNLRITYRLEPALLGTAGGVKGFADDLRNGPFVVIYGDNYCPFSLQETIGTHLTSYLKPDMSIVLFHQEDVSGSGVAICDASHLIGEFMEKPSHGQTDSHWVNAGIYVMESKLLDLIPEGKSDFGHDVIPNYLRAGIRLLGVKTTSQVYAVDTPELLARIGETPRR